MLVFSTSLAKSDYNGGIKVSLSCWKQHTGHLADEPMNCLPVKRPSCIFSTHTHSFNPEAWLLSSQPSTPSIMVYLPGNGLSSQGSAKAGMCPLHMSAGGSVSHQWTSSCLESGPADDECRCRSGESLSCLDRFKIVSFAIFTYVFYYCFV